MHISKADCIQSQFEWFCQVIFCQKIGYTTYNYLDLFYLSGCAHFVFNLLSNVITVYCTLAGVYMHLFHK